MNELLTLQLANYINRYFLDNYGGLGIYIRKDSLPSGHTIVSCKLLPDKFDHDKVFSGEWKFSAIEKYCSFNQHSIGTQFFMMLELVTKALESLPDKSGHWLLKRLRPSLSAAYIKHYAIPIFSIKNEDVIFLVDNTDIDEKLDYEHIHLPFNEFTK